MPVSVGWKLRAFNDLLYEGKLDISVYPVALTIEQVEEFNLPSTPLKRGDKRADRWREQRGREQTEIDALIAVREGTLGKIAEEAAKKFIDSKLCERVDSVKKEWNKKAQPIVAKHLQGLRWF